MNTYLPVTWLQVHSTLARQEVNHHSFPQRELRREIAGMSEVEGAQDGSNCQKQLAHCATENSRPKAQEKVKEVEEQRVQ